jgi:hypothetical protein
LFGLTLAAAYWGIILTLRTLSNFFFEKRNIGGNAMIKVKTFASPLKIFHARKELEELDTMVNKFIEGNNVQRIISVSDAPTSDDNGAT